jgi:predicted membrane channel-forming protein YqfA (hemolysin III family)
LVQEKLDHLGIVALILGTPLTAALVRVLACVL